MTEQSQSAQRTPARPPAWLASALIVAGLVLIAVALAGVFLTRLPGAAQMPSSGPARVGHPLADFALQDLAGKTVRLSDYAGRPVLINTWATWCPPCRAEMPYLQAFYQQHQAEGFVVLAVNVGESAELAQSFVDETGLTFPILLDPDEAFANAHSIQDFPTSILIGRDGKVKGIHIGMFMSPEQLAQEMAPVLKR